MALKQYGVLKGKAINKIVGQGSSPHYGVHLIDDTTDYLLTDLSNTVCPIPKNRHLAAGPFCFKQGQVKLSKAPGTIQKNGEGGQGKRIKKYFTSSRLIISPSGFQISMSKVGHFATFEDD